MKFIFIIIASFIISNCSIDENRHDCVLIYWSLNDVSILGDKGYTKIETFEGRTYACKQY